MYLIEKLIHRVRVTTENVKSLALSDVYGRLARLLHALQAALKHAQWDKRFAALHESAPWLRSSLRELGFELVAAEEVAPGPRAVGAIRDLRGAGQRHPVHAAGVG